MPGKVIETKRIQLDQAGIKSSAPIFGQCRYEIHLGGDGYITDPYRGDIGSMAGQRFSYQPGRVGKIDQQGSRAKFAHIVGNTEDDRNGTQCLGHSPDPGRLLPYEAVPPSQILILAAGMHPTHAQLGDDIAGALNRLALVEAEPDRKGTPPGCHHALGKTANHVESFRPNVHQA